MAINPGRDTKAPGPAGGKVRLVDRRHPEWAEHQIRWRWLMDSYEGADRYRQAVYGTDSRGLAIHNMIRHKREYPEPREQQYSNTSTYLAGNASSVGGFGGGAGGADQAQNASDDDFEMRRARTPVPTFLAEAVSTHLGEIYAKEIRRDIPPSLDVLLDPWMEDVDGKGTDFATWMQEEVAPLFLVLGQLDLCFEHPVGPEGDEITTRADSERLRLDRCVVTLILPENLVWWKLNPDESYAEVLVREILDPDQADSRIGYRHWTAAETVLYSGGGIDGMEEIRRTSHRFGRVPIVRIKDRRKARCKNIGQSRYESIAERQREYYNRDSELILSDSTQAHPLLQGPEDYIQADGTIPIGPSWLLPKKKNQTGGSTSYEGFSIVDFPKGTSESIRSNMAVIRDDADRDAALTKPAGATGTGRGTVGQSGLAKAMDQKTGTRKLASIAASLARAEGRIFAYALVVLKDDGRAVELAREIEVVYPTDYNLFSATELAAITADLQDLIKQSGEIEETEKLLLTQIIRAALPGFDDSTYQRLESEVAQAIDRNAGKAAELAEGSVPPPPGSIPPSDGQDLAGIEEAPEQAESESDQSS